MSAEALPPYSHNSDRLPSYSRFSEAPTSKEFPNHYVTRSRRMVLDLGHRYQSTPVPAFGREGLIEGHVWVQSFDNVEKIQVTLTGAIVSCFFELGGIPSRPCIKRLTHQTAEIWCARGQDPNASQAERALPFALVLPEHIERTEDGSDRLAPLPPSESIVMRDAAAHVAYIVRVDMFRKGWRSHDTVKTEVLYFPRTTTHYSRPYLPLPNSEKLRPCTHEEWSATPMPQMYKAIPATSTPKSKLKSQSHSSLPQCLGDDTVVRLFLPVGLRYPAGRQVLWDVTFVFPGTSISASSPPSPSNEAPSKVAEYDCDALAASVFLRLVRVSTVAVRGVVSSRERVIAVGEIFNVKDTVTSLGERKVVIMGTLQPGEAEKEMSWGVSGFASVVYKIRVSVKLDKHVDQDAPIWEYSEQIVITSHEADGEMHNAGVPALLLPGATRDPVPLNLLGL